MRCGYAFLVGNVLNICWIIMWWRSVREVWRKAYGIHRNVRKLMGRDFHRLIRVAWLACLLMPMSEINFSR